MSLRLAVKYFLIALSTLDLIRMIASSFSLLVTLMLNVDMWCWAPNHSSVCSPRAVVVSYLMYAFVQWFRIVSLSLLFCLHSPSL